MAHIRKPKTEQLRYVYFDGAQAEARIVGWEGKIASWMHQFELARLNPGTYDAHLALAEQMFGIPQHLLSRDDYFNENTNDAGETVATGAKIGSLTKRGKSKRCRHGLNYRMQAPKLAEVLRCLIAEATMLWNLYHSTTPELRRWWQTVIEEVRKTRQLWTCLGRRIEFLGDRLDDTMLDAIIAFKPQSTLGDLVCTAQQRSQDDDDWPMYARIPFNNHDSLTALCRERDVQRVARIMKKYAEAPLVIHGEQLIIPAEFKISVPDKEGVHRWYQWGKLIVE